MIDEEIAAAWPDRWAKANAPRPGASKRRNNLRKSWKAHVALKEFIQTNPHAQCANCTNLAHSPIRKQPHCLLDSDYYGDQLTTLTSVCTKWKATL